MQKVWKYLRNKYLLTGLLFLSYTLFLDDIDIFFIVRQNKKLEQLQEQKTAQQSKLDSTKATLGKLEYREEVERYAREEKFFKKENEDIFVISYE